MFELAQIQALVAVIGIDLVLSGDNAVVIGAAAAGLPLHQRHRAIIIGIVVAAITRILFSMVAFYLLKIVGLLLVGGLLLAWVAWAMWRDLRQQAKNDRVRAEAAVSNGLDLHDESESTKSVPVAKSFGRALMSIVIADVSMSLDNVLAVAGAARDHLAILIFGLALSIALMGFAANYLASLMEKHRWIAYIGAVLVTYVALEMIWRGVVEVRPFL